jgi:single-strand DNA-binding protein
MKSVNKVILVGNLTRDPEIRQTDSKKAVCSFGLATNRSWTTDTGRQPESVEGRAEPWVVGQLASVGHSV